MVEGAELSAGRRAAALLALALGGFGLGLTEFIAIGLLPNLAADLLRSRYAASVSDAVATVGWVVTVYGLGVVVGAPTIAVLTARVDRRRLVISLLGVFVAGNLVCATAPTFALLLVGRFVAALAHGAYFGAAGALAASLLGPGSRAKGYAVVLGGLTTANVVGIPVLTRLGQVAGWRAAFLAVVAVFVLAIVAVLTALPALDTGPVGSPRAELRALGSPRVWLVASTAAIGFSGFFAVNTYLAPVATEVTGLSASTTPWVLVVMGLGMTAGNAAGGPAADHHLRLSIVFGFAAVVGSVVAFALLAHTAVGLFASAFLVGAACLFLGPALQSWLIGAAPQAQLMAAAVNQSATNLANSLGAAIGGAVIAVGGGYLAPAWTGAALAGVGLALAVAILRLDRPVSTDGGGESRRTPVRADERCDRGDDASGASTEVASGTGPHRLG